MVQDNLVFKAYRYLKDLLVYKPPSRTAHRFVLGEYKEGEKGDAPSVVPPNGLTSSKEELEALIRYGNRLATVMEEAQELLSKSDQAAKADLAAQLKILEKQQTELEPVLLAYDTNKGDLKKRELSFSIEENEKIIKQLYFVEINKDIVIRHFIIPGVQPIKAMLVFMDGMIDKELINLAVLQPLMILDKEKLALQGDNLLKQLISLFLPSNQAQEVDNFGKVAAGLNTGDTALFLEGINQAVLIETKGYEHRSVGKPEIEQSVRGSQVAFSEALRVNTGLIRTMMPSNDLVTEIFEIGERIPTKCAIMYLKSVANPKLIGEIKRRILNIKTDYISDMGVLEQFIEDHPSIALPQMLSTERPDRTVAALSEGRVAILLNGTPFAHVVPVSFFTFFHSAEDFSLKVPIGSVTRLLRLIGTLLAVILPAVYLSIVYFHPEALPTEMILAIAGARERVPFPSVGELLLMEFAFELIREAGLRIPGLLGSTIGIVGAIILGQAAVSANLVSPVTVVVIALTGLASFTIPDYRLAAAGRLLRFVFIALAYMLGLVGVALGLLVLTAVLTSMKSFGVPYMVPIAPKTMAGLDVIIRGPVFRQEMRPDGLNTQDNRRQPHISRQWTIKSEEENKP
ncbi:spore germination protein [Sporomusaceae bacterium FL31]|nr:spore germination protein [Sporomusaceae bacterium FL31]GCE34573.1 spore germination protein [Sporomusaceae bacterium]